MSEVVAAVANEAGRVATGIRLSPNAMSYGVEDSDPHALFTAAAAELSASATHGSSFASRALTRPSRQAITPPVSPAMRHVFHGRDRSQQRL